LSSHIGRRVFLAKLVNGCLMTSITTAVEQLTNEPRLSSNFPCNTMFTGVWRAWQAQPRVHCLSSHIGWQVFLLLVLPQPRKVY
jgi:hypothetical protein